MLSVIHDIVKLCCRGSPVSSLYKLPLSIIFAVFLFLLSPDIEMTFIELPVLNHKGVWICNTYTYDLIYIYIYILYIYILYIYIDYAAAISAVMYWSLG